MQVKSETGFTLVETIIAIGMFALILVVLLDLYDNYNTILSTQQAWTQVANSASLAMNNIQNVVLQADQFPVSHTFPGGGTYSTNTTTLVAEMPAIDSSGNVIAGKYDYTAFYTNGVKLYQLAASDSSSARTSGLKQLSGSLGSIAFTYNNAVVSSSTKVDVDIITQKVIKKGTVQYHLHQQIYLRN